MEKVSWWREIFFAASCFFKKASPSGLGFDGWLELQEKKYLFLSFFMFLRADIHISKYVPQFKN
jgi:hypothetical protein